MRHWLLVLLKILGWVVLLLSWSFQDSLSFSSLIIMRPVWISLSLPYLDFVELLGTVSECLSSHLESGHCFFKYSFYPFPLFSCWDVHYVYVGTLDCVPQASEAVYFFIPFFPHFSYLIISVALSSGSLTLSFARLNLQVSPSSGFLFLVIVFFQNLFGSFL